MQIQNNSNDKFRKSVRGYLILTIHLSLFYNSSLLFCEQASLLVLELWNILSRLDCHFLIFPFSFCRSNVLFFFQRNTLLLFSQLLSFFGFTPASGWEFAADVRMCLSLFVLNKQMSLKRNMRCIHLEKRESSKIIVVCCVSRPLCYIHEFREFLHHIWMVWNSAYHLIAWKTVSRGNH